MYEAYFGLNQRPFTSSPNAARYFPAPVIEQARQTLMRCIQRSQGTGLLVGPTGTGKTLLCQVLGQQFRASHRVVLLAGARLCTRRALLQTILFELGLSYRGMSEGELRLSLTEQLDPTIDSTAGLLLLVDEADTLPVRLLEELRMLTNIVRQGQPRVQLVLAGAPTLEERFANPKFESFQQRIAARCYLQSLTREETFRFVAWQVESAGGRSTSIFDATALQAIHDSTGGIPRLINQVCDYALHRAADTAEKPLTARHISLAWSELQQLPSPWAALAKPAAHEPISAPAAIIEFRALDDLPPLVSDALAEFDFSASPTLLDDHSAGVNASVSESRDEVSSAPVEVSAVAADLPLAGNTTEPIAPSHAEPILDSTMAISEAAAESTTDEPFMAAGEPATAAVAAAADTELAPADLSHTVFATEDHFDQATPWGATSEATVVGDFSGAIDNAAAILCAVPNGEANCTVIRPDEVAALPTLANTEIDLPATVEALTASKDLLVSTEAAAPSLAPSVNPPELRVVRDETPESVVPKVPPAEERRRRFRLLFSRLRGRASA